MTLESIGQKLKAAREAQGLSLRQIYERTKIPINHLQSIDTGMPDDLPEPVYVAGFIKRYAECIGLDGQVLADEYRRNNAASPTKAPSAVAQQVYVTPEYLKHARIDNRPPTYKLWPFYVVTIVVLIIVLSWYTSQQATNTANQGDPNTLSLKDAAARINEDGNAIDAATGSGPGGTESPSSDKIAISATQHVWVEVKKLSTGESLFTGFLEQGDRREFDDPQGIRIRAGNGGSLSAEFKGKIESFGEPGKPAERTFSPAVAAVDPAQSAPGASSKPTADAATSTVAVETPRKPVRKSEESAPRRSRSLDDGGSRSLPGDSYGQRYSEGRLDAN